MAKYKVRIEKIYPELSESQLFENKKCILGISMSNPVFWRSSLKDIIDWTKNNFECTYYVVADYLHRHGELLTNKAKDENEAIQNSIRLGNEIEEKLKELLADEPTDSYKIIRWKDIFHSQPYAGEISTFYKLYEDSREFAEAINYQANKYVASLDDRNIEVAKDREFVIKASAHYLIEELAVFSKMMETGVKVLAYPGTQLPIFIALAEGKYHKIIPSLSDGIYVHLKVIKK